MNRKIQPASHIGDFEKFDGEIAEIIEQMRQRVVVRIDGPDCFIQGLNDFPRGRRNSRRMFRGFRDRQTVLQSQFIEQQNDSRDAASQIVMQIAGDARSFFFNQMLQSAFAPVHFPPACVQ